MNPEVQPLPLAVAWDIERRAFSVQDNARVKERKRRRMFLCLN